jgi:hypothetical protein
MITYGTKKYCPFCKKIVMTHVLTECGQVEINGVLAKRRKIIHPVELSGCGSTWYTIEIVEDTVNKSSQHSKTER